MRIPKTNLRKQGETKMKTLNTLILTVGAAALLGTTGLYAQTGAVAKVPFNFTVSSATMPAGEYSLRPAGTSGVIMIQNLETGRTVYVQAPNTSSILHGNKEETGTIAFHRYGDRYFFSEVWTPEGLHGRSAPGKLERELKSSSAERQMASVSVPLVGTGR
jgi:hypothetical protein